MAITVTRSAPVISSGQSKENSTSNRHHAASPATTTLGRAETLSAKTREALREAMGQRLRRVMPKPTAD